MKKIKKIKEIPNKIKSIKELKKSDLEKELIKKEKEEFKEFVSDSNASISFGGRQSSQSSQIQAQATEREQPQTSSNSPTPEPTGEQAFREGYSIDPNKETSDIVYQTSRNNNDPSGKSIRSSDPVVPATTRNFSNFNSRDPFESGFPVKNQFNQNQIFQDQDEHQRYSTDKEIKLKKRRSELY